MTTRYRLHGLVVESPWPLSAPVTLESPSLHFEPGPVSSQEEQPDGELVARSGPPASPFYEIWRSSVRQVFRFFGVADVVLDAELCSAVVHPAPGVDDGLLPVLLAGNVLAYVLAERGGIVLHASCVLTAYGAVAIAGPSGAGKSTFAALAVRGGATLLTDDVLLVDLVDPEAPTVAAGADALRLRLDAASAAELLPGAELSPTADGRTAARAEAPPRAGRYGLAAVLALVPGEDLEPVRVSGSEALLHLTAATRTMWAAPAAQARTLRHSAAVCRAVPVYEVSLPRGPVDARTAAVRRILHIAGG